VDKTEKFSLHFFIRAPPKFFSIKETKIILFCLPANAGIAETPPPYSPPSAGRAGGQKFLPPDPIPFCPPAGNPQRFFLDGGASNWMVSRVISSCVISV